MHNITLNYLKNMQKGLLMNEQLKKLMDMRVDDTIKALNKHHFPTFVVENVQELQSLVSSMIQDTEQVSVGGSVTLDETGILDMLRKRNINFMEHDTTLSKDIQAQRQRMAFSSDTYLCSVNAVTEQGELYNVDGNGNRVAAITFGPKQVLLIVSTNKIVRDMDEAVRRVQEIAAPANCLRLQKATPCAKVGHCMECQSNDRICATHVVMNWQKIENRIKVIFIKEPFGY